MTRKISKKRGVSVVISTLLVLAITIVGALSISNLMSTSALTTVNQTPKAIIAANSVLLTAYDTRDGANLFNIVNFDNNSSDLLLCALSCAGADQNKMPNLGGTDFIVVQLWNKNTNPIQIKSVNVNGVPHVWDTTTREVDLDPTIITNPSGEFPRAGMYSIIPTSSLSFTQQKSQQVDGDQEVILVIKLNPSFTSNISLGNPLHIGINIGDVKPAEFIILTGDTK